MRVLQTPSSCILCKRRCHVIHRLLSATSMCNCAVFWQGYYTYLHMPELVFVHPERKLHPGPGCGPSRIPVHRANVIIGVALSRTAKARILDWHRNGHHLLTPEDLEPVVMAGQLKRMGLDRSVFFEILRRVVDFHVNLTPLS